MMNRHLAAAALLTLAGGTVAADDQRLNAALGGAVGGGLGALVGNELGGRDGAIVGGALGAAAMTAVTTNEPRPRERVRYEYHERDHHGDWYAPRQRSRFCPPGHAKKGEC